MLLLRIIGHLNKIMLLLSGVRTFLGCVRKSAYSKFPKTLYLINGWALQILIIELWRIGIWRRMIKHKYYTDLLWFDITITLSYIVIFNSYDVHAMHCKLSFYTLFTITNIEQNIFRDLYYCNTICSFSKGQGRKIIMFVN